MVILRKSRMLIFVAVFISAAMASLAMYAPAAFAGEAMSVSGPESTYAGAGSNSAATKAANAKADAVPRDHTINIVLDGSTYRSEINLDTHVVTIGRGTLYQAVQPAFDHVRRNNDGQLWRVVMPKGDHSLGTATGLYIYSNTIFDLRKGATIYAGEDEGQILRSGRKDDSTRYDAGSNLPFVPRPGGYDDYTNIYVLGGTFVGHQKSEAGAAAANRNYKGCNIRFGHASDIHIMGVTVKDNVGAHHIELGAVKDCEIVDCTFSGSFGSSSLEAVQLDITHRHQNNFTNYWPYDDLPTVSTTIENCAFNNVTRGVGSHHIILGATFDGITIKNNTFTNIADRAIAAGNFTNSTITGNKMTNVNSGVFATNMVPGQTYLKINDSSYTGSKTLNMNLKITNNTIGLKNSGTYGTTATKYGIRVGGAEITDSNKSYKDYKTTYKQGTYGSSEVTKNLPVGAYYTSGVTITGNTITGGVGNITAGLLFDGANSISASNNKVSAGKWGVKIANSTAGVKLNNNSISGAGQYGVFVLAAKGASVTNNKVKESVDHGIRTDTSSNITITGNVSSSTKNTKEKFEISVAKNSKNCTVKNNKLGSRRFVDGRHVAVVVDNTSSATVSGNVSWARLWGNYALDTMAEITKTFGKASTAVVATNASFKDSLAAAALAGSLNAPMLTTSKAGLSAQTKSELQRMGVKTVYLVGSTGDVAANVVDQMKKAGVTTVTRIAGGSASIKAVNCAKAQKSKSDTVIIATQANFKDALSISPYAYATKSPVLYIETDKKLSSATVSYIKSAKFKKAIIVGGPVPIPAAVETQLKGAGIAAGNITRLAGSNEYKTSRVIAEWATGKLANGTGGSGLYQYASVKFQPAIKLSVDKLGVARADNPSNGWKDALAGAALCGKNKSVLLLCDDKATPYNNKGAFTEEFVKNNKSAINQGYVFGGKGAVSANVFDKMVVASR